MALLLAIVVGIILSVGAGLLMAKRIADKGKQQMKDTLGSIGEGAGEKVAEALRETASQDSRNSGGVNPGSQKEKKEDDDLQPHRDFLRKIGYMIEEEAERERAAKRAAEKEAKPKKE